MQQCSKEKRAGEPRGEELWAFTEEECFSSLKQEKLQTLHLCREAQMWHNEINQKGKLGEEPKAVLITRGQFSLRSAGGGRGDQSGLLRHSAYTLYNSCTKAQRC